MIVGPQYAQQQANALNQARGSIQDYCGLQNAAFKPDNTREGQLRQRNAERLAAWRARWDSHMQREVVSDFYLRNQHAEARLVETLSANDYFKAMGRFLLRFKAKP